MLSLCMIVKDEEKNLPRVLTACKDVVDEMIIVDTGSSDKTKEVAQSFGAKVYDFTWVEDFSAARNESLKHATGDWILVLDADEVIFKEDLRRLKAFLEGVEADAFFFNRREYSNERNLAGWVASDAIEGFEGYTTSHNVRLFRKDPRIYYTKKVHEGVEDQLRAHKLNVKYIDDVPIHHLGYQLGETRYKEMLKTISDRTIKQDYELALGCMNTGELEEAHKLFKSIIARKKDYAHALRNLGTLYMKAGKMKLAGATLQEAIKAKPEDTAAYNNLGVVFKTLGHLDQAAICFKKAAKLNRQDPRPLRALALVLKQQGKVEEARKLMEGAVKSFPNNSMLKEALEAL